MISPDVVNGALEALSAAFIANSCRLLYAQKRVRGVSALSTAFFVLWGFWHIYYYPHLDQWWSFLGGLLVVGANGAWLAQMCYYNFRERLATRT